MGETHLLPQQDGSCLDSLGQQPCSWASPPFILEEKQIIPRGVAQGSARKPTTRKGEQCLPQKPQSPRNPQHPAPIRLYSDLVKCQICPEARRMGEPQPPVPEPAALKNRSWLMKLSELDMAEHSGEGMACVEAMGTHLAYT